MNKTPTISKKNLLGLTGIEVSPIGLGTVKFGRNQGVKFPEAFELPNDVTIIQLLKLALDLGINLIDTAPAYGISEERLGKLLPGHRQDWILCTKVGEEYSDQHSVHNFTPEHTRFSVQRSLTRLNTHYLDSVLVHSHGNDLDIIHHFGTLECLAELKQQGLIRSFGMSTKTVEGGKLALKNSDLVMVTYNPVHTEEYPVIEYAHQNNKGILIKKTLASGHLNTLPGTDPVHHALDFCLTTPGVTSIILGTINAEHLKKAVACIGSPAF